MPESLGFNSVGWSNKQMPVFSNHGASATTNSALDHFIHQDKNNRTEKIN